ncbi:uncharacterized protein LOC133317657 isoform X2 [Gastrolobium bilobum]|uniref:uncharacterized protein LOC133317657 isoform X2 n=1 Tax=Gastrolobium bilobum TaxID=150636 RepID=UPI002AB05F5F|nr:uncharacterized protein LOC133317657 isoform X2 [Gastrolobium bilobum]
MMSNRNGRDSLLGSLNHHRRGQSFNGVANNDDNLDLFSKNRRSLSVASSDDSSDVSVKLGRLSVGGPAKPARSGIDDLLSAAEGGKHDYDWLLTPPGTPVFPASEGESQSTLVPPRRSMSRSTSTTKASRLSVSQSENSNHSRPARSSSVARPSISTSHSQYSTYSSNRSSTSILNTSSASVSSYIRPSSPITRSTTTTRPSTPSSRTTPSSRSSTPSKVRSVSTSSSSDKHRPSSQSSRPSTPSSRPHIPANLHSSSSPSTRSLSRPSTPTRRSSMPSLSPSPSPSPTTASSTSSGRVPLTGRSSAPVSRASSPSPRVRPPPQPVVPPDFPLETPPNLRTTLLDRPVSAGRSRPGSVTLKGNNSETQASVNMPRRHSSPIVSRGRLTEPAGKSRGYANANGHHADVLEPRKVPHAPEVVARKSVKASTTTTDNSGFGRTISKKSLDMAIKHMDIRNSSGNLRSLSSTTLFPQSIRNSTPKSHSHRVSSAPASVDINGSMLSSNNGANFDVGNDEKQYSAKLSEVDIYESSRYDALLLKEDLKNTNWLHGADDDKCDQGLIFDNGFEHLPEPFGLL